MNFIVLNEHGSILLEADNLKEAIDYGTKLWNLSGRTKTYSVYIKVCDI